MPKSWKTKLIHSDAKIPEGYRSLASPTFRGSTTVFPFRLRGTRHLGPVAGRLHLRSLWHAHRTGTCCRVCELESGTHTILTPGGQAAISLINLALLQSGDHMLVPCQRLLPEPQASHSAAFAFR